MAADLAVHSLGLWSVAETADRLGVPPAEVEDCLAAGDLPHLSVGDRQFVPASAVRGLVGLTDAAMACCRPGRVLDSVVMPLAHLAVSASCSRSPTTCCLSATALTTCQRSTSSPSWSRTPDGWHRSWIASTGWPRWWRASIPGWAIRTARERLRAR